MNRSGGREGEGGERGAKGRGEGETEGRGSYERVEEEGERGDEREGEGGGREIVRGRERGEDSMSERIISCRSEAVVVRRRVCALSARY